MHPSGKQKKFYALAIIIVATLVILTSYLLSSPAPSSSPIFLSTAEIREGLATFIIDVLDNNKRASLSVNCDESGNCDKLILEDETPGSNLVPSETWKIEFYTSLFQQSNSPDKKEFALNRSLELLRVFNQKYQAGATDQVFVLANAFDRTGNVEFLKTFLRIEGIFADFLIKKDSPPDILIKSAPMSIARAVEQLLRLRQYLMSLPSETLESVNFSSTPLDEWYKSFLLRKDLAASKIPIIANELLKKVKGIELQAADPYFTRTIPLFASRNEGLSAESCWELLADTQSWKSTNDSRYLDMASYLIQRGDFLSRGYGAYNIRLLQGMLPCLESFKILGEKDAQYNAYFKRLLSDLVSVYFDGRTRPRCSGINAFLSLAVDTGPGSEIAPQCSINLFNISDIAWLYSILVNQDFNVEIKPVFVE